MSQSNKWIEGLAPEGGVREAARLSLEVRFGAVSRFLPLAAEHAHEDVEHVHRLRVATRRATAALRLYADWLPQDTMRWLKKRLRKIRRAAGEARDLDVLAERLHRELGHRALLLLDEISRRRAAAQPAIVAVAERCARQDRFQCKVHRLLGGIAPREKCARKAEGSLTFHDWARQSLTDATDQFFEAMPAAAHAADPGDGSDTAALHQFRIRGKALRYAVELLAPAFGPELRGEYYPVIEQVQERLGRINDHVVGAARLRDWCHSVTNPDSEDLLEALMQQEQVRLAETIAEFHQWWTPERAESLRSGLAACCA
jgi:CHAD domain-containing protein